MLSLSRESQQALVKFLVRIGVLDAVQADNSYAVEDQCPIAFYAQRGCFDEWDAIECVAKKLELRACRINSAQRQQLASLLQHPLLADIPPERWMAMRALPVRVDADLVEVLMSNPLAQEARSALEFDLGVPVRIAVGCESEIIAVLRDQITLGTETNLQDLLSDADAENSAQGQDEHFGESELDHTKLDAPPVVRLVNKIFYDSIRAGASDIHIVPQKESVLVKIRVDGIMRTLFPIPAHLRNALISRIKLLGGMDIAEHRKPQDGRLRLKTQQGVRDLRLSAVPSLHGENIVARILSGDVTQTSFAALGMPDEIVTRMKIALGGSSRVVLVCGPTGSGKSSTLYAGLLHLRDGTSNIVTVEDPIEYRLQNITQIQVNPKTGMTFAAGLRSILRQDPDVIMVGEIRDGETASIAMQAAQTGHLVLSTLHTNTAAATITRLRDLGIPDYLIVSSLGTIVAQRLVRLLCTSCRKPAAAETVERCAALGVTGELHDAQGCDECGGTGYRGRKAIFSVLEISDDVKECIRQGGASEEEIERAARRDGFERLEEAAFRLMASGATSLAEVERVLGAFQRAGMARSAAAPAPDSAAPAPQRISSDSAATPRHDGSLRKRRVLLVEDDRDLRIMLMLLLQREMFDVQEACNGYEALEKIYAHLPDLVLTDLMMPEMGGLVLVQRLRKDPRTASVPIIVLTAADSETNEVQIIGGGADDFVSKTANSEVMLARIHRLLGRSQ